ncbi:hypothetical protein AWB78_01360 [Caballeronia calidae]|uniref:Uncharacterized protein n=1 Tax=Caballeronia calidae TaxID=1777139 RepID=A0A158A7K8_9BURK|nr:BPSL0761 family protein [Caballeronia calidae]SAK53788.1 hypothetical protein AWB78_01360 [Caballeronia calidae]
MTTATERAGALIRARELLLALTDLRQPVNVVELRLSAARLLRHYPDAGTVELIAEQTQWLEVKREGFETNRLLTREVSLPPLPPSVPDGPMQNESFFEDFRQRELESLREKVETGELVPADEFRRRLKLSQEALRDLLVDGSVFAIDVDGIPYFPSLLADGAYNKARLFSICRIIWPEHPTSRLHYLTSGRGNLGGLTPLECLSDIKRFRMLERAAWAETVDSYRTSIVAYAGLHDAQPTNVPPSYSVAEDLDRRRDFWAKGSAALKHHGFTGVFEPYEQLREATVFISQIRAGSTTPDEGAKLSFSIDGDFASVHVERFVSNKSHYLRVRLEGGENVEDAMRAIFRELWNRGAN